ncbi:hypothetical protein OEZ85_002723 [Tetradesmus obliquus]|uniref:Uncharacterized protein n=1 Tax=Tetradesmus obliquus TaxID=3088 RepID=A0ABY8TYG4_TETOB|nr:hypothetical protein OEZ85_002723 [Tetradesmus obliquus]
MRWFNFSLPLVNVDIPWFSLSLPNLTLDVDASAPIEAAAVIIDTAAGVVRESTKLLPMIDNVLTMIGWNDLKEFLNFVMGIVDLVKNQLLNTLDIIISIVDKIVNALQHIQCPEEISFICFIGDLIQDAIKDILKAIEDAVDLEGWVKKIISILPIDELLKVFKSVADLLGEMNPAGLFMEKLKIDIEKWIDQFIDMFVPYIDLGQFNPLNGLFCKGDATKLGTPWALRPGIYKKAATRLAGNPMTFVCPGDYYPVVDTAERRMWMCTQRLSVLMRLPCPAGASTCTVDYDTKYGDTVCKQPEVSGLPQGEELTAYREMYGVDRLDGEDVFKATYLCVPKNMTFNVIAELMNM